MSRPLIMLRAIDSHAGGEPTRLIVDGFPNLSGGSMAKCRNCFTRDFDHWHQATVPEPHGNDVLVDAPLCKPVSVEATAGVISFSDAGFLGMCGHGTIGFIASLARLRRIQPGVHLIEIPVSSASVTLHDGGSVSVQNVLAHRWKKRVHAETVHGSIVDDIVWGGSWSFLINDHPSAITPEHILQLTTCTQAMCEGLEVAGTRGDDGGVIDRIELFTGDGTTDSRNFVLCPGKAWDRSSCGTGVSAKLACLTQDGKLQPGGIWRQTNVIGSQFTASYQRTAGGIIPMIRSKAWVCRDNQLILSPDDPSYWGIVS